MLTSKAFSACYQVRSVKAESNGSSVAWGEIFPLSLIANGRSADGNSTQPSITVECKDKGFITTTYGSVRIPAQLLVPEGGRAGAKEGSVQTLYVVLRRNASQSVVLVNQAPSADEVDPILRIMTLVAPPVPHGSREADSELDTGGISTASIANREYQKLYSQLRATVVDAIAVRREVEEQRRLRAVRDRDSGGEEDCDGGIGVFILDPTQLAVQDIQVCVCVCVCALFVCGYTAQLSCD